MSLWQAALGTLPNAAEAGGRAGSAHLPAQWGRNRSCGTRHVLRCMAMCIAWPVPKLLCIVQLSMFILKDLFFFFFSFYTFCGTVKRQIFF